MMKLESILNRSFGTLTITVEREAPDDAADRIVDKAMGFAEWGSIQTLNELQLLAETQLHPSSGIYTDTCRATTTEVIRHFPLTISAEFVIKSTDRTHLVPANTLSEALESYLKEAIWLTVSYWHFS